MTVLTGFYCIMFEYWTQSKSVRLNSITERSIDYPGLLMRKSVGKLWKYLLSSFLSVVEWVGENDHSVDEK